MGIQLPLLDDQYKDSEQSSLISGIVESEKPEWEKVNQPKTGNVVVLKIGGRPCHVGIYLERNRMIHTVKGINSCIERLDGPKWKNRIDGYYQKK